MQFNPGTLVRLREREWIVMPSGDPDVLRVKPLGGHEIESTGVYLPLLQEEPVAADFPYPTSDDLADFESAQLLYDAARLALRTGAGPFRSFGRLSVRPRAYQLVPLIMALKQEAVRLLIADDVGIGKTIEALLIVRELYDRGIIERFAVLCPPHLCNQWASELKDKFGFDAEIVRSDTAARLDRRIQGDASVFRYYPFQVISLDYIKSEQRRELFLAECPELVVVDEAHTCARPPGAQRSQQQRHHLVHRISQREGQHLLMLTATPHSGKEEAFQSLLGMLRPEFETMTVADADRNARRRLARHFVQRRRRDVEDWMEATDFPDRTSEEVEYPLSTDYKTLFDQVLEFARGYAGGRGSEDVGQRLRYWTALALLRGVISSPRAGEQMLRNRANRLELSGEVDDEAAAESLATDALFDPDADQSDLAPTHLREAVEFQDREVAALGTLADWMAELGTLEQDYKAQTLLDQLRDMLDDGFHPIVFCRYINTANYLEDLLKPELEKAYPGIAVEAVTSELNDEQRKERVDALGEAKRRVLIATDCLSEGINLQQHFTAVVHYDLPWNPNRIEQREGRIDRYGQAADEVKTLLMIGDNPIDGVIVNVLLRKTRKIRNDTGISIPFPEDSKSVTDALTHAVLLNPEAARMQPSQLSLGMEFEAVQARKSEVSDALDDALNRELGTRSIFKQLALKPDEIEPDLRETDEALGSPETVERFMLRAAAHLGVQLEPRSKKHSYRLVTAGLPPVLRDALPGGDEDEARTLKVTFHSPVPEGHLYLGRNHPFVEQTCQYLMRMAFEPDQDHRPARAAVVYTDRVETKTTVALFRVRNVIADKRGKNEFVAEEVLTWGYEGGVDEGRFVTSERARDLLLEVLPTANMALPEQAYWLGEELADVRDRADLDTITKERTAHLIEAHERYRAAIGGTTYEGVEPVLPPDLLGLYVLIPDRSAN
jgi:superfamily II DNA or RNA helicase